MPSRVLPIPAGAWSRFCGGSCSAWASRQACRPISPRSTGHVVAGARGASSSSPPPASGNMAVDTAQREQTTNPAPGPPLPNSPFTVFDRSAKLAQKQRAALRRSIKGGAAAGVDIVAGSTDPATTQYVGERGENMRLTDYVKKEMAQNLAERLTYIKRDFPTIVELGSGPGFLRHYIDKQATGCQKIIMCDASEAALRRDEHLDKEFEIEVERKVVDEESLPFEPESLDIIVAPGTLHWTNDLPGALVQIRRALKPDGVFVGALLGGDTLFELRTSLQLAEVEREGGISPRVSPMTETRDMASLLGRAGFNMPTVDSDEIEVHYPSIYELLHDLRDMGESNAVVHRRGTLRRDTLLAAGAIYEAMHGIPDAEGVPATYAVIYVIGWKPDESQRKALPRGSASHSLRDVLGKEEQSEAEGGTPGGEASGDGKPSGRG